MSDQFPRQYPCIIEQIIDGDTVVVSIDRGHDIIHRKQAIRLRRIDTAEASDKDPRLRQMAAWAKELVEAMLPIGSERTLLTYKTPKANKEELEKFGRFQGDFGAGWQTLTEKLVAMKLAARYSGKSKATTRGELLALYATKELAGEEAVSKSIQELVAIRSTSDRGKIVDRW